jgi:hypothetical protein
MTSTSKPLQITALFMDPSEWAATKQLGQKKGVSAGALVRQALAEFLKREAAKQSRVAKR